MKIVFYINYLNHHQVALTDELYRCLGLDFLCVITRTTNQNDLKGGFDFGSRSYCLNAAVSLKTQKLALKYAVEADVCLFGAESIEYAIERAKYNTRGISFEVGERWFKKGLLNMASPRFIKWLFNYYRYFRKRKFYRLCASAFAAGDVNRVGAYIDRCYRWGYFINVDGINLDTENIKLTNDKIRIMWCSRFIAWKHPELAIGLAAKLKGIACNFVIDMYGSGDELESTKELVSKLDLEDVVQFHGSHPNHEIIQEMCKHDIFLLTSDRNEGWGVVVNEAMMCSCVVVGSNTIGSVPYLIEDKVNGVVFQSGNVQSLFEKVVYLIENKKKIDDMGQKARNTIVEVWSPANAVGNLLKLIEVLYNDSETISFVGPCQAEF